MKSPQISNRYASLRFHLNVLPWVLLAFVMQSSAQTFPALFRWGFKNNFLSSSLPTCLTLPIVITSLGSSTNTLGTPPYYMVAFVVDGTPVTTFIGTDPENLSYTVTEPTGSRLALNVIDANGRTGGIPPIIYTVIDGQTTQCVTTPPATPEFKITANVSKQLSTCQPWGIAIKGGVPPYTITLQAVNSGGTTNATIPFGDDAFTYINRAPPNTQLLAAVSDFTGRWANGTAKVNTIGSTNASCTGLVSSSGNLTIIQQHKHSDKTKSQSQKTIVLVVSVVLVIGLSVAVLLYLRKRIKQADAEFNKIIPRPWSGRRFLSVQNVRNYLTSIPRKGLSSQQNIETKIASPVQPDRIPSLPPLARISTSIAFVPNHTRDQARQDLDHDSRPFSVSDYISFDDNSSPNAPRSLYSPSIASFATFPLTSVRPTQQFSRGSGRRTEVINQNRRALSAEAELFNNEPAEPALSDRSDVLPRSVSYAAAGKKKDFYLASATGSRTTIRF